MKILFKQQEAEESSALSRFGVHTCYFKKLSLDHDRNHITRKTHHHTGFEMHIVTDGYQEYDVEGTTYRLESGNFLLIYPNVSHTVVTSTPYTKKYSISFHKKTDLHRPCFFGTLSKRMYDNIIFASNEAALKKDISATLVENSILEILVSAFRLSGIKENDGAYQQDENAIISLAIQYIDDNIEAAPNVANVAAYCYLSTKHLTRLFNSFEGVSPGEYIINRRIKSIENLLADQTLSLKQISEKMGFSSEYYFNTFFKKHSGMPPGEYRKMLGK